MFEPDDDLAALNPVWTEKLHDETYESTLSLDVSAIDLGSSRSKVVSGKFTTSHNGNTYENKV